MASVMIADASNYMRDRLTKLLKAQEHRVYSEAYGGESAILLYRTKKPDLAVISILLPGMSGIEVTREITTNDPEAKIILVSPMQSPVVNEKVLVSGARELLVHPFTDDEFLNCFKDLEEKYA